ncbi:MAG TPA: hypothetical protein VGF54_19430, partial [Streptosporangiaceae bacterium]
VAAWEAVSRRAAAGAVQLGMAVVAIAGLMLLIRPDRSVSVPVAGLLLALLAAVLHAAYILLGRGGWDQVGDGAATFLIVAAAALGLGVMVAATRPAAVLAPVTDPGHTGLLLLVEGVLAGEVFQAAVDLDGDHAVARAEPAGDAASGCLVASGGRLPG